MGADDRLAINTDQPVKIIFCEGFRAWRYHFDTPVGGIPKGILLLYTDRCILVLNIGNAALSGLNHPQRFFFLWHPPRFKASLSTR
jgi:hypothetical protein